jgi:hypothetical protein
MNGQPYKDFRLCKDYANAFKFKFELLWIWRELCDFLLIKKSFVNSNGLLKSKNMDSSFDKNITILKK